jgi:hypothetical protein
MVSAATDIVEERSISCHKSLKTQLARQILASEQRDSRSEVYIFLPLVCPYRSSWFHGRAQSPDRLQPL